MSDVIDQMEKPSNEVEMKRSSSNSDADGHGEEREQLAGGGANRDVNIDTPEEKGWAGTRCLLELLKKYKKWVGAGLVALLIIILTVSVWLGQGGPLRPEEPVADVWWKSGSIYAVFLASYMHAGSSSASGRGNIQGLISKLDYIKGRGFSTVWISTPVYQAFFYPGNEVEDYYEVFTSYGNLSDFKQLVKEAKTKELRIIMDLEINHSSDEHKWLLYSKENRTDYGDLYIWRPCEENKPPNNWKSVYGDSAWSFFRSRSICAFHQFRSRTADFNYRSPQTFNLIKEVLKFWLERGVDGLHFPNAEYLLEDTDLSDIDYSNTLQRNRTEDRLESYTQVVKPLRDLINDHGRVLFITADSSSEAEVVRQSADAVFHRDFILHLKKNSTCNNFVRLFQTLRAFQGEDSWPLWMAGTWDHNRLASRLGSLADGFQAIQYLLWGTPVTYYGEEIGMVDMDLDYGATRDLAARDAGPDKYREISRDPFRTPMQWSSTNNAGFTVNSRPYLPVNPNYVELNVEQQLKTSNSLLKRIERLNQLHKEFLEAEQTKLKCPTDVLHFERRSAAHRLVVLVNFGEPQRLELEEVELEQQQTTVELSSGSSMKQNFVEFDKHGVIVLRHPIA